MSDAASTAMPLVGPGRPPRQQASADAREAEVTRLTRRLIELEGESLRLYRALPRALAFHMAMMMIRLLDGANQAGRTLAAMVELARAMTGTDPYGKYPKENMRILVVGYDGDHLADPMWSKLARPGAFDLIRDERTKLLRSVRPNPENPLELDPYDAAYREKWVEAPPLLPERFIKSIAWEDRAKDIPRLVTTITGTQSLWRSSKSKAVRGRQFHLWLFDEEIENDQYLVECLRGSMRYGAKGIWSATAQSGGMQLYELYERAQNNDPNVSRFPLFIYENPFYEEKNKQAFYDSLSEDERRVRWFGEYAIVSKRVYPTYDPQGIHGYEPREIPPDWCIWGVVDPGTQRLGFLSGAVDPEEKHLWLYDGFDLRHTDARQWAGEVASRAPVQGYQGMIMDYQMGKAQTVGLPSDTTVAREYWKALQEAGVTVHTKGPMEGFYPGSPNIPGREEAVRSLLAIRGVGPHRGTPTLQVARGVNPDLDREIKRAHMKISNPKVREKKYPEDLLQPLEYLAAFGPGYSIPPSSEPPKSTVDPWVEKKRRKARRSAGRSFGNAMSIG